MDRADNSSFCEKFQQSCPDKVMQLRTSIRQDVKETDGQIIYVRSYSIFSVALPPLERFPVQFGHLFKDTYIDLDMQDDLERSDVINWCRTTKALHALKTTADGNCLLHAISQGMWGVEDSELFLRRLLYVNLVTDPKGAFKKRWMFHQRHASDLQRFDVRLNTVEYSEEWDSVIKATDDLARSESHGLPYTALESIHLFVSANMLRRPIIVLADAMARTVFGETIQDNQICGIYLPLEWSPDQCHKNPIVIGYNMNHFAPLVFEEEVKSDQNDVVVRAVPLVTKEMDSVPARYLMPNEEADYINILRNYIDTTEVFYNVTSVPAAKVTVNSLPESVNIVDACRIDCERKFRRYMDQDTGVFHQQDEPVQFNFQVAERQPRLTAQPVNFQVAERQPRLPAQLVNFQVAERQPRLPAQPVNFQVAERQPLLPAQPRLPARQRLNVVAPNGHALKHCATIGCMHFANPEMQNMCSKCFNDFTIQYARQEDVARRVSSRHPLEPVPIVRPALTRQVSRGNNFHDLSMMGEDCHAKCGFKCSTETYPYCHECYPKFVGTVAQQPEIPIQPAQQEFSIMPEECRNPNCSYKCSKATFPYCHDCFPQVNNTAQAAPTAPPPSLPVTAGLNPIPMQIQSGHQDLQLRIQSNDETAVIVSGQTAFPQNIRPSVLTSTQVPHNIEPVQQTEPMEVLPSSGALNKKCKTLQCESYAIKGNNGYCDNCYQLTLFGTGNIQTPGKCANVGCEVAIAVPVTTQCLQCFLKGDTAQCQSLTGARAHAVAMNFAPMPEEKILNHRATVNPRNPDQAPVYSLSGASMRSKPTEHEEAAALDPTLAPKTLELQVQEHSKYEEREGRKYICATPGCEGLRTDNQPGVCHDCMRAYDETIVVQPPSGSNLEQSTAYPSCSPVPLSKEEMKELNPVVISSRDKIECASSSCRTLIYPPKKLCDTCSAVLQRFQAKNTKQENIKSVGENSSLCLTQGCQFFGAPNMKGYCSSCYKAQVPTTRFTVPLSRRNHHTSNTAPITPESQQTRNTVPIATTPRKAKLCIEKGCSRYGDPSQSDRCSEHYELAVAQFPPISPASLEQQRQIIARQRQQTGNRYNVTNQNIVGGNYRRTTSQEPQQNPHTRATSQFIPGTSAAAQQSINRNTTGSPNVDSFEASYGKLFSGKKSTNLCKNNSVTGCSNYGNSAKLGYCNTCHPEFVRKNALGQNGFR